MSVLDISNFYLPKLFAVSLDKNICSTSFYT
jgi:hypothetical protein